jgi:hypothetical protein
MQGDFINYYSGLWSFSLLVSFLRAPSFPHSHLVVWVGWLHLPPDPDCSPAIEVGQFDPMTLALGVDIDVCEAIKLSARDVYIY